jgi:hypothetical protein
VRNISDALMTDPADYLRPSPSGLPIDSGPQDIEQAILSDPYLQPVEGGYYKCILCPAKLPGPSHLSMHLEGKMHSMKLAKVSTSTAEPDHPGYFEQYAKQFLEGDIELTFGMIGSDQAPAHFDPDMKCELCETSTYGWDHWVSHFTGMKHMKSRRNCLHRLYWQRLDAQYPYYYEHISGMWQLSQPKFGHVTKDGSVILLPALN